MNKFFLFLCLSVSVLAGCTDIFDQSKTLVFGYTDRPWILRTKATDPANSLDMVYLSVAITGNTEWKDIDHLIYLNLASQGPNGTIYSSRTNSETFSALCQKHGDTKKSPVGSFREITRSDASLYHFFKDFITLEVTSTEDFDSAHPAGSSLLDILHYATDSPYRVLRNDYRTTFETDALTVQVKDNPYLSEFFGEGPVYRQLFNTFKSGADVQPEDLTILGNIYLSFDKLPEPVAPKHIRIRMTADDGAEYDFDTVLTFEPVDHSLHDSDNK